MGLETATYIDSLVETNPTGSDDRSTADDHLRLLKASLKRTFANINGEVRATPANLNYLTAVAEDVQAKLNTLSASAATTALRVASLSASVAAVESNISTVSSQAATNASRINSLSASVSLLESRVDGLEAGSAGNAARIDTLSISVSIVEASISALNSRVSGLSATFTVRTNQLSASIASAESHINSVSAAVATKVDQSGTMVVTTSSAELKFTGSTGNPYLRITDLTTGGLYGMSHSNATGTTTIYYKGSAGATTRQMQLRQDGGIKMYPAPNISSSFDLVVKQYVDGKVSRAGDTMSGTLDIVEANASMRLQASGIGDAYAWLEHADSGQKLMLSTYNTASKARLLYNDGIGYVAGLELNTDGTLRSTYGGTPSHNFDLVTKEYADSGDARRGALVYPSSSLTIPDVSTLIISFDAEDYDTDNIHSTTLNQTRLTVPQGVTKVRLSAQVVLAPVNQAGGTIKVFILRSFPAAYAGEAFAVSYVSTNLYDVVIQCRTAVLNVEAGQYFELQVNNDLSFAETIVGSLYGDRTWFEMEILE